MLPFSMLYLPLLKLLRKNGLSNFPAHQKLLQQNRVYPLIDHYYDPRINYEKDFDFSSARNLHINWNIDEQLACLGGLKGVDELRGLPRDQGSALSNSHNPPNQINSPRRFYFNNPAFSDGDADIYYLMIRNLKPKRIIEIGSGFSTLMAVEAIQKNKEEQHDTVLTCIEPYEFSWLEQLPEVKVLRERVENIPIDYFSALEAGDILFIEASRTAGNGRLIMTGQLGDVMKESAQAALTLVKSRALALRLDPQTFEKTDVHVHVPAGAIPKDGPSAGVAMFIALASLFMDRPVASDVAMTGEISLRGLVLPVGGIKEKVIAAMAAGIKRVMLPERNRKDLEEVPQNTRQKMDFIFLKDVEQAMLAAIGRGDAEQIAVV